MDIFATVSSIMTKEPIAASVNDTLADVNNVLKEKGIHHMPVTNEEGELIGMISHSDLLLYKRKQNDEMDQIIENQRLKAYKVQDAMVSGVAKLAPEDHIATALLVFKENKFHCVPVVQDNKVVGILTTHDIIKNILPENMR